MQREVVRFIRHTLDSLGLLEGLYHIEQSPRQLTVGENLLVFPTDDALESLEVSYVVEYDQRRQKYVVYTQVSTLHEALAGLGALDEVQRYAIRLFERDEVKGKKFLMEFLSQELFYACYGLWKQNLMALLPDFPDRMKEPVLLFPAFLTPVFEAEFSHPCIHDLNDKIQAFASSFPEFFPQTRDLIAGMWLHALLKGMDQAFWKWGVRMLIERMFRDCRCREFTLAFRYGSSYYRHSHKDLQLRLAGGKLGQAMLGPVYHHACGDIEVCLGTPSREIYLAMYPGGQARNFASEVVGVWLGASMADCTSGYYRITWDMRYTGRKIPASLPEGIPAEKGLYRLGYSFWLDRAGVESEPARQAQP